MAASQNSHRKKSVCQIASVKETEKLGLQAGRTAKRRGVRTEHPGQEGGETGNRSWR